MAELERPEKRRIFVTHNHRKRSLFKWLIPLIVVIAIMVLLPRVVAMVS